MKLAQFLRACVESGAVLLRMVSHPNYTMVGLPDMYYIGYADGTFRPLGDAFALGIIHNGLVEPSGAREMQSATHPIMGRYVISVKGLKMYFGARPKLDVSKTLNKLLLLDKGQVDQEEEPHGERGKTP